MALLPAICTQCGATVTVDDSHDAAICQYCGTAFIVEKAINTYNISNTIHADTVIIQNQEKEFEITGGILSKYRGNNDVITLPDEVYAIDDSCFKGTNLKKITFNAKLKKIGLAAFKDCQLLEEVDTSLCTDLDILDHAFENCSLLTSYDFQNVIHIGTEAFRNTGLKHIVMPEQGMVLDSRVFNDCKKLVIADLGDLITKDNIYDHEPLFLFDGCDLLLDIRSPLCSGIRSKKGELDLKTNDFCWWTFGACMFTHFMCGSGYYDMDDRILKKHEMPDSLRSCVYCHGKMGSIQTGLFSSYYGCLQCHRKRPGLNEYDELLQWTYEQAGYNIDSGNDQTAESGEQSQSYQPKTSGDISLICSTFVNNTSNKKDFTVSDKLRKGLNIPANETVYIGHDDTLFKTGKNGFAITEKGIYVRETLLKPAFISFETFGRTNELKWGENKCSIWADDTEVCVNAIVNNDDAEDLMQLYWDILFHLQKETND